MKQMIRKIAYKIFFFPVALFLSFFSFGQTLNTSFLKSKESNNQLRMIWYLKQHQEKADFVKLGKIFLNDKGINYYKAQLLNNTDSNKILKIKSDIADQMLRDGRNEEAIEYVLKILPHAKNFNDQDIFEGNLYLYLKKLLAMGYFRLGEEINCLINHTSESCILPIQGKGVHLIKDPMQNAIKIYSELLESDLSDIESMWLLNIAYMTLGLYPDSVPLRYRIPINTFDVKYPHGKFKDIAPELGLDERRQSGSVIMDDFDNDNDLDIFFSSMGFFEQCKYFVNNGDGTFSDKTSSAGFMGEVSGRTCIQADYNNDGYLDIYIVRGAWERQEDNYPPSSLMRNNGDGTFTDVTIQCGLLAFNASYNGVWFDYNNDGWIDLFVSNESIYPERPHPAQLFKNNGDGTFSDVAKEAGLEPEGWTKGAISFDYNNDGWPDLYLCRADGRNFLFRNDGRSPDGKVRFTNVTTEAGVPGHRICFYTVSLDFNNDGWIDLFTAKSDFDYRELYDAFINEYNGIPTRKSFHPLFYMNNKDGTFRDATEEVKLDRIIKNMGINAGDIDNDGYPDLYAGTGALALASIVPNVMLRNNNGKYFEDVSASTGTGNLQHGHGVSFGDIDNDGDQDIFQIMGDGYSGDIYSNILYENPGSPNHWINLKLEGTKSNRAAIGARVKVNIQSPEGERNVFSVVSSGGSFGASCLRREIGLANASKINYIEVNWPRSGITQKFTGIEMDKYYKIAENGNKMQTLNIKAMKLGTNNTHKSH